MKRRAPRRRRRAPAARPWLLDWWPIIAFGLLAFSSGVGAWWDLRMKQELAAARIEALMESVQFLSAQVVGPKERGR